MGRESNNNDNTERAANSSDRSNDSRDKPLGFEKSSTQEKGPTERGKVTQRDLSPDNRIASEIESRPQERLSNPKPKGEDAPQVPSWDNRSIEEDWNTQKQNDRARIRCRKMDLTPTDTKIGEITGKLAMAGVTAVRVAYDSAKAVETGAPADPTSIVNFAESTGRIVERVVSTAAREIRCLPDTARHYGDPPAWNAGGPE